MYPKMLVMRNTWEGCIWQAYRVLNEEEERILTRNARRNGFLVEQQSEFYTTETSPGWRDDACWQKCLSRERKPVTQT